VITLYRPGTSILHRAPAGVKILVLAILALAISLLVRDLSSLALAAAVTVGAYLLAGLGVTGLAAQVVAIRWIIVTMLGTQLVFLSARLAALNTGRVVIVIVLVSLLSLTTLTADLLDATDRACQPLRRIGVDPAQVALLLAMTVTTIPVIAGFASTIRDAQRARGVPLRLQFLVVPLLIMSLRHADDLADAVAARASE
jgi:biotin transport system permease protein